MVFKFSPSRLNLILHGVLFLTLGTFLFQLPLILPFQLFIAFIYLVAIVWYVVEQRQLVSSLTYQDGRWLVEAKKVKSDGRQCFSTTDIGSHAKITYPAELKMVSRTLLAMTLSVTAIKGSSLSTESQRLTLWVDQLPVKQWRMLHALLSLA
jgi:hypothetical protein